MLARTALAAAAAVVTVSGVTARDYVPDFRPKNQPWKRKTHGPLRRMVSFRPFTDEDELIRPYEEAHRKLMRRHEILCRRVAAARRGPATTEYRKKTVRQMEVCQVNMMDAGIPLDVISAHYKIHA